MKYSIIPIFIPHLGCPHNCVFCNQRKIAGTLKSPTPYEVRALIEKGLLVSGHPAEIAFYGGSFTAIDTKLQESYLDTAYTFIKTGLVSNVRLSTRPDCIDDKTILRLKKYGVTTVELGAQSMDDGILKLSGRGHTKKDIIEASRKIKNSGMKLILQMMCGLPGDTREKDIQTAMEAAALSPDGARIYPAVVVADTALYEWYKSGEYRPLSVDEACSIAAEMLEIFEDAGIPVIRIGLNASETLSNEVVAGAYHPSLGEMTRSRLYLKRAASLLESRTASGEIRIGVNPSCISLMVGQKRENIRKLEECYPGTQIKVRAVDVLPGKVVLLD